MSRDPRPEAPPILGANIEPFKFYVATNSDQRPDGEFPFWVNLCEGRRVAWGFSVWRGRRGYRTLGTRLDDWLARPGNAAIVIREDRDRRLDKCPRKPKPADPRDAEIAALRAQVEELQFGAMSWHKAYEQGRREANAAAEAVLAALGDEYRAKHGGGGDYCRALFDALARLPVGGGR